MKQFASAPDRVLVQAILAVAFIARLVLVMSGGQFYWPDEERYRQSRAMIENVKADVPVTWQFAHPMFKVIGLLPAAVESTYVTDARIPATFFALFSIVNIWLLVGIARRLGAGATEVALVALLFASSTSFLYFSRHLFPYDTSLTFGLLALRAGTTPEAPSRASLVCGAWAGLCFLTYFGYWTFGGAVCVIHVFRSFDGKALIRRGVMTAVGLATPLLFIVGTPTVAGGNVITATMSFMGEVTQGTFAEGWRVPFEYLWHAEHGLLLLWIASVGMTLVAWRRWLHNPRVRVGLAGALFIYGTLAVFSTGFEAFVVYGRLARQLVPFLCLVTAAVLAQAIARRPAVTRLAFPLLAAAIVIQAAVNAWPVFRQQFPREFISRGEEAARRLRASRAIPLYTAHLYPPAPVEVPAGYVEALSAAHPLQYLPYQYEGFTPEERQLLRTTDFRMRMLIPADDTR